ncbi:hypothetical protein [Tianweitania sediminis]|uniref:Uncharacterized protein n=1 Tax=Tianweitania sediminis TaxID=1502156 RepID=A0A8J7R3A0_9HYPH|nr:hypothetical protein [Tianweitania sediminis]MBP0440128.1 hypothetical protein [Tianweitania sediminis]HEV7417262.1 hypothetical protein [Tianweitania sediminis]
MFAMQMEFWWAINQLPSLKPSFGFQEFLLLVLLTLMLFLAAALLLPSRAEDEGGGLRAYFEQDGRFALLALSAFLTLGAIINVSMFGADLNSGWAWLDLLMILVPVAAYLARSRRVYASLTGLYVPLAAVDTWVSIAT